MSLSSSYLRCCKWINSHVLVFLIMLLCLIRLSRQHFFYHCLYSTKQNAGFNSTSIHNQKHVFSPWLFSLPVNWSLDLVLVCSSATRHIAVIPKTIKKGIYPIYMADPSESGQPATDRKEDPDWLLNLRKKDAERKRKERAKSPKKPKAVPGWMRKTMSRKKGSDVTGRVIHRDPSTKLGCEVYTETIFPCMAILLSDAHPISNFCYQSNHIGVIFTQGGNAIVPSQRIQHQCMYTMVFYWIQSILVLTVYLNSSHRVLCLPLLP